MKAACFTLALAALGIPDVALAHGPLVMGDVAVVGIEPAFGGEETRVVLLALRDLHDGDAIELTDAGLTASGALRPGEGSAFYEVIRFPVPRGTFIEVRSATLTASLPRDQVLAYRGRFVEGALEGAWLDAVAYGGPWASDATSDATSAVPPPLSSLALSLPSAEAMAFIGSPNGTADEVWARVHDAANWRTGPRGSFPLPARAEIRGGRGDACSADADCGTGFCVDSVCCNTACNRGASLRCEWCDFGVTSADSGTCGVAPRSIVCRTARSGCDASETCDGVTTTCPPDGLQPAGYVCRRARGTCDVAEVCDGVATECPGDARAPSGTICRESIDADCDAPELCDGIDFACGADIPMHEGEACTTACGGVGVCTTGLCEASECPVDAGPREMPRPDAGRPDAGRPDAARLDAGPHDAGQRDAAQDASTFEEAGLALDAAGDTAPGRAGTCAAGSPRAASRNLMWVVLLLAVGCRRRRTTV